ncbi:TPA: glycosyltransferase [Legionella pneumophila]|nr:glycosyltransferase [Legionella pneumophila]
MLNHYKIAIIMAVYKPNTEFFLQQLLSIKNQTYSNFVCFCHGDGPHHELFKKMSARIADDRFRFVENQNLVGFYDNFRRGLSQVSDGFDFIALSNQDDIWHPDNLEKKIRHILQTKAELVYGDARLIDEHNKIIAHSLFKYSDLPKNCSKKDILLINSLFGMSMVFTKKILEFALPFPPQNRVYTSYHDWWLAAAALTMTKVSFLNEATVDYRQHANNLVGAGMKKTLINKFRTFLRCVIVYPFYPKYSIVRYCKRNRFYKDLQKHLMGFNEKPIKLKNLEITWRDLIKTLKGKSVTLIAFCWLMMLARAYLAFKPTRKIALKMYRRAKS